jgi:hypothetical protein
MATLQIKFEDIAQLNSFVAWFLDGGGEQGYFDYSECHDEYPMNTSSFDKGTMVYAEAYASGILPSITFSCVGEPEPPVAENKKKTRRRKSQ